MKKWLKILIIVASVIAVLSLSGFFVFKYYIEPKIAEPVVNALADILTSESSLKDLYENASAEHDAGNLDDDIYTKFINAYNKHTRDDEEFAHEVLDTPEGNSDDEINAETSSLHAKYASHKVGVEIIKTTEDENAGKASTTYSSERNSNRPNSEDAIDAKKIRDEQESGEKSTEKPIDTRSAYAKLKENMDASEFTTFVTIMAKLDINTIRGFADAADKQGLKDYLHSRLNNNEYKKIVNLGYKYAYLFMED